MSVNSDPRHPFEISHGIVSYPFPLSDGSFADLILPIRISADDAERLTAFIATLVNPPPSAGDTTNT